SGSGAGAAPGSVARLLVRQAMAAAGLGAEGALGVWLAGQLPAAWLDLEPRARKLALHGAVAEAWQAAAARIGRLWVGLDDWDQADATSRELLAQLWAAPDAVSWCIAGGPTPDGMAPAELPAWTPAEVATLVTARLGEAPPAEVLDALTAIDARRPGLVNALLEHWHAGGALEATAAGWAFTPAALTGSGADAWDALWREKLARLPDGALDLARVLGTFEQVGPLPAWALGEALELDGGALQAGADALIRLGVASQAPAGLRLAAMPQAVRPVVATDPRALATRLARSLAGTEGNSLVAAGLAVQGEDNALALDLATVAARQALDQLAVEDALRLLEAARARLDHQVPAERRIAVHLAAAEVERLMDRKDEAAADLQAALDLAEAAGDDVGAATALAGLAKGHQLAGRYAEGLALATRARDLAERAGAQGLAARATMVAARIQVFNGALGEARASCARAAELAAAGGAPLIRSHALNLQGVLVVQHAPDQREAGLALIREALTLTEAAGDMLGTAAALENLGNVYLAVGELREAEDAFERCAAICTTHRVVAEGLSADMNLALVRAELGETAAAFELAEAVAARAGRLGRAFIRAVSLAVQGQAAWRAARFDEAFLALDEALTAVLAIKNRFAEEYIRLYRLEAFLAAGSLEAARAEAAATAEVVAHTQHAEGVHRLALYQARLALAEGDLATAAALAEPLLASGHAGLVHGAHHVLAACGDPRPHLEMAIAIGAAWRAPWHAAADELALARTALEPDAAVAHARAALQPGPNLFARAGAACVLAAHGQHEQAGRAAIEALLAALPPEFRAEVLAAQGLPAAAVLSDLAAKAPQGASGPTVTPWLGRVLDAADERGINEAVLEAVLALVQADRGYLLEYEHGRLVQVVTVGLDYADELDQGFSSSIVEEVLLTGEPVYSFDAATDDRWSGAASVRALGLRTVVGLPYGTPRRLMGVVYAERAAVEPVLGSAELYALDLLARTGAERVAALRMERELLEELAFEREVATAAMAIARSSSPAGRRAALLAAAIRLTGAERAFWLTRPGADAAWRALAAQDPTGEPLAYDPSRLSTSVLARTVDERAAICLVDSDEPEGWTPGKSVLALGLRMVWCVPVAPDARELVYLDTQHLTAVDPQRMAARLTALTERLLPLEA
ncbi:MAG: Response regulator of zinc sigma-54-dependent two-component system, partial [Cyanobacteria bacterium RYN_339]|nr:Response regulator of zinc sigma-54-dependent two-component system [Cyanobacteria bacterium RYN_339]